MYGKACTYSPPEDVALQEGQLALLKPNTLRMKENSGPFRFYICVRDPYMCVCIYIYMTLHDRFHRRLCARLVFGFAPELQVAAIAETVGNNSEYQNVRQEPWRYPVQARPGQGFKDLICDTTKSDSFATQRMAYTHTHF